MTENFRKKASPKTLPEIMANKVYSKAEGDLAYADALEAVREWLTQKRQELKLPPHKGLTFLDQTIQTDLLDELLEELQE